MNEIVITKKIQQKLLWLCLVLWCGRIWAGVTVEAPVINSISVVDTHLNFVTTFPPDVVNAGLELRPTLTDAWQSAARLNVPAAGGVVEFTIPKPALDVAFFRLKAVMRAATNSAFSTESQFVTMPPLGPDGTNADEAVFHFKGVVDGSDQIVITRQGAWWQHVNWGWPDGAVTVNATRWNPSEKNFLTTTGAVPFLPENYSLTAVSLEKLEGRDVVALERTNSGLVVYLNDTPPEAAPYEFKIHFKKATAKPVGLRHSPRATLKIAAQVDGSDLLKITAREATWQHGTWSSPGVVRLNDIAWDSDQTNILMNTGTNTFLPATVDFSTAKIIHRQGRDVSTMWADKDALWVSFADNPNGSDAYELDISFGQ